MKCLLPFSAFAFLLSSNLLAQANFIDVSAQSGINNTGNNRGISVVDYNGDGWEDLYVSRLDGPNLLYRNNSDGTFTDVAQAAGVAYAGPSAASVWGDLDNDGWPDLVLGNRDVPSQIYRNNGNGSFTEVTFSAGFNNIGKVHSLMLADVNNDGRLDIYIANLGAENALFMNMGNWFFQNMIYASGATDPLISMGGVFFDYDNDGDQDLYLTHDANMPNILYRNDGTGHFANVSMQAGVNLGAQGMGVDVGDMNNDGYMDIYITNLYENALFINNGNGTFANFSGPAGVNDRGMGWGTMWFDYNNDCWPDIYVNNDTYFLVNGVVYDNLLYQNQGNLTFTDVSSGSPVSSPYGGYGVVHFDANNDGLLDMALANTGNDGNQLFLNQTIDGHHWIALQLEGVQSNRSAIGARVVLQAGSRTLSDQVIAGSGFCSQNTLNLHFGLENETLVDQVTVYWPSGFQETFTNLAVDTLHHLLEMSANTTDVTPIESKLSFSFDLFPNPAAEELFVRINTTREIDQLDLLLMDARSKLLDRKQLNNLPAGASVESWNTIKQLPDGIYFIAVNNAEGRQIRRLVKVGGR